MQGRLSEAGEDTLQDYVRNAVFFFFPVRCRAGDHRSKIIIIIIRAGKKII